jgi:CMP-N,N'-diacetyllegionaminic acid synthase
LKNKIKNLVIIPARGGSKRLKNKNKKILNDIPLIEHTIKFAVKNSISNYILLSTDDRDILEIGLKNKILTPWLRPSFLSNDNSKSISFAIHAINWFENLFGELDNIILLQPTSPYRNINTFKKMLNIFMLKKESIVTVKQNINKGKDIYTMQNSLLSKIGKFKKGGVNISGNIYINSVKNLKKYKNFVNKKSIGYLIKNPKELIDIDTLTDFKLAKKLLKK